MMTIRNMEISKTINGRILRATIAVDDPILAHQIREGHANAKAGEPLRLSSLKMLMNDTIYDIDLPKVISVEQDQDLIPESDGSIQVGDGHKGSTIVVIIEAGGWTERKA